MKHLSNDSGFDDYRRERNQRRMQSGAPLRPIARGQDVLREIEAAEAREVQEQRLTREVHDFFAEATRTAAGIVQKVTDVHESEATVRLRQEMEDFLRDTIKRAQSFISILAFTEGPDGERIVETHMQNLVGKVLDQFRSEGTAELEDKHFGLDPMAVDLDEASAALRQLAADPSPATDTPKSSIEEHLVAEMAPENVEEPPPAPAKPRQKKVEPEHPVAESGSAADGSGADDPLLAAISDPKMLKETLKALVRAGVMTKEAAQTAYRQRLQPDSTS